MCTIAANGNCCEQFMLPVLITCAKIQPVFSILYGLENFTLQ